MLGAIKNKVAGAIEKTVAKAVTNVEERKQFLKTIKADVDAEVRENFDSVCASVGIQLDSKIYGDDITPAGTPPRIGTRPASNPTPCPAGPGYPRHD